jgi:hypothetical protein
VTFAFPLGAFSGRIDLPAPHRRDLALRLMGTHNRYELVGRAASIAQSFEGGDDVAHSAAIPRASASMRAW